MEFIILKVNGTDLSSFSYEDSVNAFVSAREPIVVEVKRRESESSASDTRALSKCMSTAVQTDLSGQVEQASFEYLSNDVDFEEVTLRKCNGNDKLGLTVCYSSGSDVDTYTEVYIQTIAPNSVAHSDGRLREGDQILQVNGKDVTDKDETESLFSENPKAVTLLVSRSLNQNERVLVGDSPTQFLSRSSRSVAYQNSLIEQLVQQQSLFPHSSTRNVPLVPPHLQLNLTNSLIRSQMYMINREISELDKRMQNIQLVKRDRFKTSQLSSESDSEHIYETIPESVDSSLEPIYSCPYESQENINLQLFMADKSEVNQTGKSEITKQMKSVPSCTFKDNSNKEEHDNSSSAYNTGGSSNSNLLTVELSFGDNSTQKDNCRSTLVLYAPSEEEKLKKLLASNENCDLCEPVTLKPNKNKLFGSKINDISKSTTKTKQDLDISDFLTDTMYTNVANLQQTILLQQQLFRQSLGKQSNGAIRKPTTSFTTPSLSQYQFVNCPQTYKTKDTKMEWKVKRRSDGSRYIARRPIRNRLLRNRALRISEERAGATTEDDTISEFKMGRYWKKEDRKKHLEKSKERKQRQESSDAVYQKPFDKVHSSSTKKYINAESTNKKHKNKRINKEEYHDFTTVQEMLLHGPQVLPNSNSKLMGLLSVTTV